mmetsp:Transcript_11233/g.37194  ORF Transcript_11233/g.37194 Transcript_11233/m.37194 type:complete len:132 (+) Transcript_11233:2-397(+)
MCASSFSDANAGDPLRPFAMTDRGSSVTPVKPEYRKELAHMREHYEAAEATGGSLANPGPKISREQMRDGKVPLGFRDNCAHLLIPLNECRYETSFLPWRCKDLRHAYEACQHHEYERRVAVHRAKKAGAL